MFVLVIIVIIILLSILKYGKSVKNDTPMPVSENIEVSNKITFKFKPIPDGIKTLIPGTIFWVVIISISIAYSYSNKAKEINKLFIKVPEDNYNSSSSSLIESSTDDEVPSGTYTADVEYTNPETGYNTTYTLDVDVEDNQIVQINFPNGGYLDNSRISSEDIDENGDVVVTGDDGKTYEVHIQK